MQAVSPQGTSGGIDRMLDSSVRPPQLSDYGALIRYVQDVVHTTTGVLLDPEIEWVGEW